MSGSEWAQLRSASCSVFPVLHLPVMIAAREAEQMGCAQ